MKYVKYIMWTLLITSFATLVMAHTAWAGQTYYVATNGKDSGPGTQGNPWKTLAYAAGKVSPGDTVLIAKGTYKPFRIKRGGQRSAEVTFKADSGAQGKVIISGNDTYGVAVWNADYVEVEGVTITGSGRTGFLANQSDHVTLRNSKITNIGRACVHFVRSDFGTIEKNKIDNCGTNGPNGEGIYLGAPGSKKVKTRGHVVRNNAISNIKDEGVDLKPHSGDILIESNKIADVQLRDGGAIHVRGSWHVIRNNNITNVKKGSKLMPGIDIDPTAKNIALSNNTMTKTSGCKNC